MRLSYCISRILQIVPTLLLIGIVVFALARAMPGDTISSVTVLAEDNQARVYPLIIEFMAPVTGLDDVTQVIVRLPDNVIGAPRDLGITVHVRGPISNKAFISIAGP